MSSSGRQDIITLMSLSPYKVLEQCFIPGTSNKTVTMTIEDFQSIIRHFLRLVPFSETDYLYCSTDLAQSIAQGHFAGSAHEHWIHHGYFEGRKPVRHYAPEDFSFEAALAIYPNLYYSKLSEALESYSNFDYSKSEELFEEILLIAPNSFKVNLTIGQLLIRTGRPVRAFEHFQRALAANDKSAEAHLGMAWVAYQLSLPDLRLSHLLLAYQLMGPEEEFLMISVATSLFGMGHLREAGRLIMKVSVGRLGGAGIAQRLTISRQIQERQRELRSIIHQSRTNRLNLYQEVELAYLLAQFDFRKFGMRILNRVVRLLRIQRKEIDFQVYETMVRTVVLARGVCCAVRFLDQKLLPQADMSLFQALKAELIYRASALPSNKIHSSEDFLSAEWQADPSLLFNQSIRRGQLDHAWEICRQSSASDPNAISWPWHNATVMVATMTKTLSFAHVPNGLGISKTEATKIAVIPKIISQYWNDKIPPPDVKKALDTWKAMNTEYVYELFNDETARLFISENYDNTVVDIFDHVMSPSMRCDFFRYAVVLKRGGFFIDADERCLLPISFSLGACSDKTLILTRGHANALLCSPFGAAPNHPAVGMIFQEALEGLLQARVSGKLPDIHATTGPGLITRVIAKTLLSKDNISQSLLESTAFLHPNDSGRISCEETFDYKGIAGRNWRLNE
jgi:tetratricopeptide (TPR) repeat protein